jgi:outer membrane protein|tara:strand:+ start:4812 stop:5342 length:531 start_codon:yes stop_codon:yes gene_type:complete
MQKFKKFYFINICVFFFSTFVFADNKTAYINVDLILSESKPSKLLFSQLKEIEDKKLKKLKNYEINLKEEEKKILSTKNIISEDEYNKSVNNFKKKVNNFKDIKKKDIENLKKIRNREIIRFFKLINPIIEKIMEENSIEILFEKKNIFIAKSNYDITQIVIEDINKNIKEFNLQE